MMVEYQNTSSGSVSENDVFSSAVLGLCWALGVPGNVAVLLLLGPHVKEGGFTPKLMLNLAVSDLLSLLGLPLWIYALLKAWVFGRALCKVFSYAVYWGLYSSVLSVSLLSVQRFLQVLYPQRWARLGARSQTGLIAGLWMSSGALAFYAPYYRTVKQKNGHIYCYQDYGNDEEKLAVLLLETVVMFIVPLLILLCFYLCLHRRVSRSVSFSSHRLTTLSVRIVVTFFIFGTPSAINNFVAMAMPLDSDVSHGATRTIFLLNSCVNPLLYAFSARALRIRGAQHPEPPQHQHISTGPTADLDS